MRKATGTKCLFVLLVAACAAEAQQSGFLDYYIAKVKPEKRAEFDAIGRKIAAANRGPNGDTWLAYETTYGDQNTVYFVGARENFGAIEHGMGAFMGSLKEAFGPAGVDKMMQAMNACLISSQGELRRRRPELSWNVSADHDAYAKTIGQARWIRTLNVRVRPGHAEQYDEALKMLKAALESDPNSMASVSVTAAGGTATVYHISSLKKSLADFDTLRPISQILGEEGYRKYVQLTSEAVLGTESIIGRFVPELSNPEPTIVSAAPDFWRPRMTAARAKTPAKPPAQ